MPKVSKKTDGPKVPSKKVQRQRKAKQDRFEKLLGEAKTYVLSHANTFSSDMLLQHLQETQHEYSGLITFAYVNMLLSNLVLASTIEFLYFNAEGWYWTAAVHKRIAGDDTSPD